MKRETIDDDVWEFVAKHGKFLHDKTWCDALRRALRIPTPGKPLATAQNAPLKPGRGNRMTERTLHRDLNGKEVTFGFGDGPRKTWKLPPNKADKHQVRRIREEALEFGKANGATPGQLNAIAKAFSDAGYYLTGPRPAADALIASTDLL